MVAIFQLFHSTSLLARSFMKASLPEVNQLTGKCSQMVRIVTKNNFFAIKISQRYDLSVQLFSLGGTNYFWLIYKVN